MGKVRLDPKLGLCGAGRAGVRDGRCLTSLKANPCAGNKFWPPGRGLKSLSLGQKVHYPFSHLGLLFFFFFPFLFPFLAHQLTALTHPPAKINILGC